MIIEILLAQFEATMLKCIAASPAVMLTIPDDAFDTVKSGMQSLGYILPIKWLLPIIVTKMSVKAARVVMAIIVRVKSFIPTMGD